MSRPWEIDHGAEFQRRLDKSAAEVGDGRMLSAAKPDIRDA